MKANRKRTLDIGSKIGAGIGGTLFAVFGIVPGFYFGSYATIILLTKLTGSSLEAGMVVSTIITVGVALTLFCGMAISLVFGSILGTLTAYIIDNIANLFKENRIEDHKVISFSIKKEFKHDETSKDETKIAV